MIELTTHVGERWRLSDVIGARRFTVLLSYRGRW